MIETLDELLDFLERRGDITTRPDDRDTCCGLERNYDGTCFYRDTHPIYVDPEVLR